MKAAGGLSDSRAAPPPTFTCYGTTISTSWTASLTRSYGARTKSSLIGIGFTSRILAPRARSRSASSCKFLTPISPPRLAICARATSPSSSPMCAASVIALRIGWSLFPDHSLDPSVEESATSVFPPVPAPTAKTHLAFDKLSHCRMIVLADAYFRSGAAVANARIRDLEREAAQLPGTARTRFRGLVGASVVMRRVYERIEAAARNRGTILIVGRAAPARSWWPARSTSVRRRRGRHSWP